MHCAARVVTVEIRHLQHFINNTLTSDRRVSMNQDRQYFIEITFVERIGLRPCKAHHNRIHGFEVRWVRREFHIYLFTNRGIHFTTESKMILHIAATHGLIHLSRSFKFTEYLLISFAENICEYIQTSAMCHADYYFFHIISGSRGKYHIQCGNRSFAAFQ